MSRPKTALNQAAEQFACPTCKVPKLTGCINIETGATVATHRTRQNLVCQEAFLNMPKEVSGWGLTCARKTGHTSQHQTLDKRLTWSRDYGVEQGRALYDELMAG